MGRLGPIRSRPRCSMARVMATVAVVAVALAFWPPDRRGVIAAGLAVLAPVIALVRSRAEFLVLAAIVVLLSATLGTAIKGARARARPVAIPSPRAPAPGP